MSDKKTSPNLKKFGTMLAMLVAGLTVISIVGSTWSTLGLPAVASKKSVRAVDEIHTQVAVDMLVYDREIAADKTTFFLDKIYHLETKQNMRPDDFTDVDAELMLNYVQQLTRSKSKEEEIESNIKEHSERLAEFND